jgi:hypothetical protein
MDLLEIPDGLEEFLLMANEVTKEEMPAEVKPEAGGSGTRDSSVEVVEDASEAVKGTLSSAELSERRSRASPQTRTNPQLRPFLLAILPKKTPSSSASSKTASPSPPSRTISRGRTHGSAPASPSSALDHLFPPPTSRLLPNRNRLLPLLLLPLFPPNAPQRLRKTENGQSRTMRSCGS